MHVSAYYIQNSLVKQPAAVVDRLIHVRVYIHTFFNAGSQVIGWITT
jgi:hypothetical protein